jgi:hypothetical protein
MTHVTLKDFADPLRPRPARCSVQPDMCQWICRGRSESRAPALAGKPQRPLWLLSDLPVNADRRAYTFMYD